MSLDARDIQQIVLLVMEETHRLHHLETSLPAVLKLSHAARQLDMSVAKLKSLVAAGKIATSEDLGGKYGIPRSEILRLSKPRYLRRSRARAGGRPSKMARSAMSEAEKIKAALKAEQRAQR